MNKNEKLPMNMHGYNFRPLVSATALLLSFMSMSVRASDGADLNELRRLVDAGQYEAAYAQGQMAGAMLGNPHFDFLFGLAAINTQHFPEGLVALERHLSAVPANDRARLELARGYYELGEYPRARQEFEFVLRYNPPKEVQANIQKYLDAMQTREVLSSRATSRSYVEFGIGHDSNVNAGTNDADTFTTQLAVPAPPRTDPAWGHSSYFWQISAGSQWLKRVDPSLAVFAGLDFDAKQNPNASDFDTGSLGGYLGFSVLKGKGLYRLSLSDNEMWVDGQKYRNTLSLTGESQYSLGQGYSLTGVAQYSELAYSDTNANNDSRMFTIGGGLQKSFQTAWKPTVGLQMTWAQDKNLHMNEALDRDVMTTRFSLAANPSDRVSLSIGVSYQESGYGMAALGFNTVREDSMWSGDVGVNYLWNRNWLVRADLQYTDNDSNQGLFTYKRALWGLHTRYLF